MSCRRSLATLAAVLGLFAEASPPAEAQFAEPFKLLDVNTHPTGAVFPGSSAGQYVEYQGQVYFFASGSGGSGLWRTDGTQSGTTLVESFGTILDMMVLDDRLIIAGSGGPEGVELWTYDGFSADLILDIRPGTVSSNPARFYVWNNLLMFAADPDGLGPVLHATDGTTAGTTALSAYKDPQRMVAFNARLFFTAKVDQLAATETNLWSWSPATGGEFVEGRVLGDLVVVGTTLFITKRTGSTVSGRQEGELWTTNGTPGAAVKLTNFWPGGNAAVDEKILLGSEVFFVGCDPASGRSLYKTDGATVTLVKDFLVHDIFLGLPPLPANSCDAAYGPRQLVVISGKLYFEGDDGETGYELWTTDGTSAGTVPVTDIDPGVESSEPLIDSPDCGGQYCRAVTPDGFFFTARTLSEGRELYFFNGTSASRVTDVDGGNRDGVPSGRLIYSGGKLFFTGNEEDSNHEPWVLPSAPTLVLSDASVAESAGTATVTVRLHPTNPGATVTANWATSEGTASDGSDFTAGSGTLTFAPGVGSQSITVPILNDADQEGDEYFFFTLSSPVNATLGNSTSRVTIFDGDAFPFLSVRVISPDVNEGSGIQFAIECAVPHANGVWVDYRTVGVTASNSDFTPRTGTLYFAPTSPTATTPQVQNISVATAGDTRYEDTYESLQLEIFNPIGGSIAGPRRAWAYIVDNDAEPGVSVGNRTTAEGNAYALHAVTLTNPSSRTVRVYWSSDGGGGTEATPGQDFRDAAGFVSIRPGETTRDITIETFEDLIDEANELYYVDLDVASAENATVVVGRGVGTITDDDTGTLSISNATIAEGDAGSSNAELTLTLNTPYYQDFTVNYSTQNATALAGEDYTAVSGTLPFPSGSTSQTVTVPVLGDVVDETTETFRVLLSASTGPGISGGTGTVTITDDDTTMAVADAGANEGNTGTSLLTVTVTTLEAYKSDFTVDYTTLAGGAQPATPGVDYVATSGTLFFPQGTKSRTFTVTVNGDVIDEPAETFLVQISNSTGPTILDGEAVGTINDNDNATVTIGNVTVTEGHSGTTDAVFTISLSTPYYQDFTVDWATAAGTTNPATEGVDYLAASGTVTFTAGTTSRTVTVPVVGDTLDEPNETFAVVLSNGTGPAIADSRGDATITDDDVLTIDAVDISVVEGNSGTTPATFTVTLSGEHAQTITVNVVTSGGGPTPPSATAGTDYTSLPSTVLTFAAGVNSQTVSVSVIGDTTVEASNESFGLTFSNPTGGAVLGRTKALATILDDDSDRTISFSPLSVSVTEPLAFSTPVTFTVRLNVAAGRTVTVNYATADGTAQAGSDYTATSGTLSFDPGDLTRTIDVDVLAGAAVEAEETFTLVLSGPTNGTVAAGSGTATAQIADSVSLVPMGFYTITPCRVIDTRVAGSGTPLVGGVARNVQFTGVCGIPSTALAVSVNLTATGFTGNGNLRLFPGGTTPSLTSTVNVAAGQTRANNAIATLGTFGDLGVLLSPTGVTGHVIIDINGYLQ
jgi:ELWxxDGT repeat protein